MTDNIEDAAAAVRGGADTLHRNPVLQALARGGYAVNGLIHLLIGAIAISVAFGADGEADQGGALAEIARYPLGFVVLWILVVGLAALGLFQLVEAAVIRGTDKDDWADRGKEAAKGVAYLAIGGSAATYALGGSSDSSTQSQDLSATLLSTPGGIILLVIVGLVAAAVGVYFVIKGARKKFLEDLSLPNSTWRRVATALGVGGYVAKGIAIFVVGVLFLIAAATTDPSGATGLDGALKSLAALPAGVVVLILVGVGLIAYGVYCFVRARFRA
jgi:hypothetical protein